MANVFDNVVGQKHVVAESSMLRATRAGHIYSLKCHANLDNGSIVAVGSWVKEQIFNSKAYVAGEEPVLLLTPPFGYNSDRREYQDECYFYNAKDEIARGYALEIGDIFTLTENAFTNSPEVGKFVGADMAVVDDAPSIGFVGEIVEKVNRKNGASYRVAVRSIGM